MDGGSIPIRGASVDNAHNNKHNSAVLPADLKTVPQQNKLGIFTSVRVDCDNT